MNAMVKPVRIVNVADVSTGEAFLDLSDVADIAVNWKGHSGIPASQLERLIRRPKLSRYRAAWHASREALKSDVLVSHLPRMTAAVADLMRLRRARTPHLAFSFNFTDLPEGFDRSRMSRTFSNVQRFCVFSNYEAALYPETFDLPKDRFHHVMWAQEAPASDRSASAPDTPYVIAIGGEGRDYMAIVSAARARQDLNWLVIARPNSILDTAPSNVSVMFNVPAPLTWGLAERASAVVVPLKTDTTCCGHITIASAQLLGLPLITTRSMATLEYVDVPGTHVVEPGDVEALAGAAADAIADDGSARLLATAGKQIALEKYDRSQWRDLVVTFLKEHCS